LPCAGCRLDGFGWGVVEPVWSGCRGWDEFRACHLVWCLACRRVWCLGSLRGEFPVFQVDCPVFLQVDCLVYLACCPAYLVYCLVYRAGCRDCRDCRVYCLGCLGGCRGCCRRDVCRGGCQDDYRGG
jgi:hypothetical protein